MSETERHSFFTEAELKSTSLYRKLYAAFGDKIQFPSVPGRTFSEDFDRAGQYTLLLSSQPMLEPTLVRPGIVRPRLGVCAHLDLHSMTPAESVMLFGVQVQQAREVSSTVQVILSFICILLGHGVLHS